MKIHKIPCDSEFRAYALIRQIKSAWWVHTHETQSRREFCVFSFNHLILYTALHKRVLSTL